MLKKKYNQVLLHLKDCNASVYCCTLLCSTLCPDTFFMSNSTLRYWENEGVSWHRYRKFQLKLYFKRELRYDMMLFKYFLSIDIKKILELYVKDFIDFLSDRNILYNKCCKHRFCMRCIKTIFSLKLCCCYS